jgi:hypothetical protein
MQRNGGGCERFAFFAYDFSADGPSLANGKEANKGKQQAEEKT